MVVKPAIPVAIGRENVNPNLPNPVKEKQTNAQLALQAMFPGMKFKPRRREAHIVIGKKPRQE